MSNQNTYTEPYNRRRQTPSLVHRNDGAYYSYDFQRFPYLLNSLYDPALITGSFYTPVFESISALDEYDVMPTSPMLSLLYHKYARGFVPKLFIRTRQMLHSNNFNSEAVLVSSGPEHFPWGPNINSIAGGVVTVPDCFQPALERVFMTSLLLYLRHIGKPFIDVPMNFIAHVNIARLKDFTELFGVDHEAFRYFMSEADIPFPELSHVMNIAYEPRYEKYVLYYGNKTYFQYYHLHDSSLLFPFANRHLETALPTIDFTLPQKPRITSLQRS